MPRASFTTMGEARAPESSQSIGVGLLGYAFMGKAHSNAYHKLAYMTWPPPLVPELVTIAGRDPKAVAAAAERYGFEGYTTDWREIVADPRVQLFDNSGPNNLHAEPTIAAAEAGKHVICEKPLGCNADDSFETWRRVDATGVKHMCAFNYRFVPAILLANEIITSGEIGEIRHFRGQYMQEWGAEEIDAWRFDKAAAGSGVLGDLGAHIIDLARFLVSEIVGVAATTATFWPGREVDDAFDAVIAFESGATGTLSASRIATGRKSALQWEINGTKGSIVFNLERMNELQVHYVDSEPGRHAQGFRTVLVTEAYHPFLEHWWPHGHIIGWEHTFVHELHHLLVAIRDDGDVAPIGATFEDGYRAAEVCDAVLRSAASGTWEKIAYRTVAPRH